MSLTQTRPRGSTVMPHGSQGFTRPGALAGGRHSPIGRSDGNAITMTARFAPSVTNNTSRHNAAALGFFARSSENGIVSNLHAQGSKRLMTPVADASQIS